jgi:hypothetical protein
MKLYHSPSGIQQGLELLIDPNWSPDQAMAVIELIDDLRDRIWSHYEIVLQRKLRNERISNCDVITSDPPF